MLREYWKDDIDKIPFKNNKGQSIFPVNNNVKNLEYREKLVYLLTGSPLTRTDFLSLFIQKQKDDINTIIDFVKSCREINQMDIHNSLFEYIKTHKDTLTKSLQDLFNDQQQPEICEIFNIDIPLHAIKERNQMVIDIGKEILSLISTKNEGQPRMEQLMLLLTQINTIHQRTLAMDRLIKF
jgi:hypothetical protein